MYDRLVAFGGSGVSVRKLGGNRAGEMRIGRFLHNDKVTVGEMLWQARARSCADVAGRHILAIQDTTTIKVDGHGQGLSCHSVLAVDALDSRVFGLIDAIMLNRSGEPRSPRWQRAFTDKDSRRWLDGANSASALRGAGAACVTVVGDREGDIYDCFAHLPSGVDMLVRAGRDRCLSDGTRMFERLETWAEAGLMNVDLPAVPGRKARRAILSLRFGLVELSPPKNSRSDKTLPETIPLRLVIASEVDPPPGQPPAIWFLLTTHQVNDCADARRVVGFYRKRWTIEQLFRTIKQRVSISRPCASNQTSIRTGRLKNLSPQS